jgi:hypothetical protein
MLKLESKADFERLISDGIQESLTLEYKASAALSREQRNEICKDVSAFANSAGGQIVYGIIEKDGMPLRVDDGVDTTAITKEWIEQIIDSNVQPRIDGLRIHAVPLGSARSAYAITIPPATTYAPHQAPDNKYYHRQNFQSVPMEDYQIRDALRRETVAKPYVEFSLDGGGTAGVTVPGSQTPTERMLRLHAHLSNKSNRPAFYTVVTLFVSKAIRLIPQGTFEEVTEYRDRLGNEYFAMRKQYAIPKDFPIFKEAKITISHPPLAIGLDAVTQRDGQFPIGYEVLTPGYHGLEFGLVHCQFGQIKIEFPAESLKQ